jgi:hypothetical protein
MATTAGVLLTLLVGAVYGHYSQRWGASPDLIAAGKRLETFPEAIGPWQLEKVEPVSDLVVQILACTGYVNRRYVNRETGQTVGVALVVGPSGPISVHTPEICYSSRSYRIAESDAKKAIPGDGERPHSFWSVTFEPAKFGAEALRVYYAWNTGSGWRAASAPRFEYGGFPLLYKLQVSGPFDPTAEEGRSDPAGEFLTQLVRSGWSLTGQ